MIRVGIIGYGKIARDQHVPAIAGDEAFTIAATVSRQGKGHPGIPCFTSHGEMIEAGGLDAVAICTPPAARYDIARDCILAGLHCLLEKPPGMSLGEVEELARLAAHRQVSLFTTWHAQYNLAVVAAAERLRGRRVRSMRIIWREDVRKWHPGQQWVWEPGGFGVFDPGINALSIATRIIPGTLFVREADFLVPANKQAPIAARLRLAGSEANDDLIAEFDWRQEGDEVWTIKVLTADGESLVLQDGGARLEVNGEAVDVDRHEEYPPLYDHFRALIERNESHVDLAPLRLTAEAFLLARRNEIEAFEE